MKRLISVCLILMLAFPALHSFANEGGEPPTQTLTQEELEIKQGENDFASLMYLSMFIQNEYLFGASRETMLEDMMHTLLTDKDAGWKECMRAMVKRLDENSAFLDKDEYSVFMRGISGSFSGIGVRITEHADTVMITEPIKGGPAYKAGLMSGDIIEQVNGEVLSGRGMEYVRGLIVGEPGTSVDVSVRRKDADRLLTFTIIRDVIEDRLVTYKNIGDGMGYIRISQFSNGVYTQFKTALDDLDGQGVTKLLIDVRNNPGGLLSEAVEICKLLIPAGRIASTEFSNSKRNQIFDSELETAKYKVVALVNQSSASASELFAAAIKERGVGSLVGSGTFGKGTIQQIFSVGSGCGLKLTMGQYVTAGGRRVHEEGVEPDLNAENSFVYFDSDAFEQIDFTAELKEGDQGNGVLAVEQRLERLGFIEYADEIMDADTAEALRIFQASQNLPVTGTTEPYTQIRLNDIEYDTYYELDNQYDAAVELLKGI